MSIQIPTTPITDVIKEYEHYADLPDVEPGMAGTLAFCYDYGLLVYCDGTNWNSWDPPFPLRIYNQDPDPSHTAGMLIWVDTSAKPYRAYFTKTNNGVTTTESNYWLPIGVTNLGDEANVAITSPAAGQVVEYDATAGKWKNASTLKNHLTGADPHGDRAYADATFVPLARRGAANGIATLGSDAKINAAQLPAIAISDVHVASSQSAMLALTAQRGDICVRTDLSKSFVLASESPSTLGDWIELLAPPVTVASVDGRTGVVDLSDRYDPLGAASDAQDAAESYADGLLAGHLGAVDPHGDRDYATDLATALSMVIAGLRASDLTTRYVPFTDGAGELIVDTDGSVISIEVPNP